MVANHFRWDFIGLSTDEKPTASTSEKVADGSTYYCSDNSKLYVWYKDQWYEKEATGGGGSSVNVVQTTGTSTTDVMSQKAVTDALGSAGGDTVYSSKTTSNANAGGAVYIGNLNANQEEQPDPTTTDNHYKYFWALPANNNEVPGSATVNILGINNGSYASVSIGRNATARLDDQVVMGNGAVANYSANYGVAIGSSASSQASYSVSLGCYSKATRAGEVNVSGSSGRGYNSTDYRVIGGVYDGQELHDCATVAQGNTLATSAPTTSTVGVLGQLYTDTTNMHTYQLTAIDTTDPQNPVYTWTQRW